MGIPAIAVGAGIAGTAVSALSQYQAGQFQAEQAKQQARLAEIRAGVALQKGSYAAGIRRAQASQATGEAIARAAESGIDISQSSTLDLLRSSRAMSELDIETIRNNAALEAWGYKAGAVTALDEARMAERAAAFGVASTLLGGAAQAGAGIYSLRRGTNTREISGTWLAPSPGAFERERI